MAENKLYEQEVQQEVQQDEQKRPTNVRVQKFLLLSARSMEISKKDAKGRKTGETEQAMQIFFLDANQLLPTTSQPVLNGFEPVISIFKKDLTPDVKALENMKVFTPVFAKISGDENFVRLHGILSDEQVAMYRKIMEELL